MTVDLSELADYTEATFRDEATGKGLGFEVTRDDDLPAVDSGADLLEQVMDNLVSNAIKYTPAPGRIEVRFGRHGSDAVRIQVRDTGIGIPEKEQDNLFQEFYRASNAKRTTSAGTGLGPRPRASDGASSQRAAAPDERRGQGHRSRDRATDPPVGLGSPFGARADLGGGVTNGLQASSSGPSGRWRYRSAGPARVLRPRC